MSKSVIGRHCLHYRPPPYWIMCSRLQDSVPMTRPGLWLAIWLVVKLLLATLNPGLPAYGICPTSHLPISAATTDLTCQKLTAGLCTNAGLLGNPFKTASNFRSGTRPTHTTLLVLLLGGDIELVKDAYQCKILLVWMMAWRLINVKPSPNATVWYIYFWL